MIAKLRPWFSTITRTLAFSIVLPLVTIQMLLRNGVAPTTALAVSTIFPLIEIALETIQNKRVGMIAAISLGGMALGFGLTFFTGNPQYAILKDSVFTFVIGAIFLASLRTSQPIIYRFATDFAAGNPQRKAANAALWERPQVRASFRFMTVVWGCGLLLEALVRLVTTLTLPIAVATSVSPIIANVAFGALALWNVVYVRSMRRRAARLTQATAP